MNKAFTKKGFTLIEILIVVAIIALLAGSALVVAGPANRLGRDTRRISDLVHTQGALQFYYSKCGYYPGVAQASNPCSSFQQISSWASMSSALTGSSIGANKIPNDPSSNKTYTYGTDSNGASYVLGATLEDANNSALRDSVKGTVFGVDCNGNNYCIQF